MPTSRSSPFAELWFVPWSDHHRADDPLLVPWTDAVAELDRRLADPLERRDLLDLHARLRTGPRGDLERTRADLLAALQSGRLLALRRRRDLTLYAGTPREPAEPEDTAPPAAPTTWFEVKLVDEVGEPLADVALTFALDDGRQGATTGGDGTARVDGKGGSATISLDDEAALRQLLRARWAAVRGKRWYAPEHEASRSSIVQVHRRAAIPGTTVFAEEPHTIVYQPRVVQIDLKGLWFATSKCFLLPTARHSLQRVTDVYAQNHESDLLIVGHTDRAGTPQYNDPLSLERAQAIAAYLKDDVEAWYAWYGPGKPADKRWGADEDAAMIQALADENGERIPDGEPCVRWYQRTRGMTIDGVAGPITRHALIEEYMALDHTTLPDDIHPVVHGCGENFPAKPTADGAAEQENRRVEIFLFENPIAPPDRPDAVLPPPPGANSGPGAAEYPEWKLRVRELHEFVAGHWIRLLMRYEDGTPAQNVPFKIQYSDGSEALATTSDAGLLMVHGVKELTWTILQGQDESMVTNFQ